jgi:hypothetical protein
MRRRTSCDAVLPVEWRLGVKVLVIDAHVETSTDRGTTWSRSMDWRLRESRTMDYGPWAVPHAIEIARGVWTIMLSMSASGPVKNLPSKVRVVDLAGVVVEQWPKG